MITLNLQTLRLIKYKKGETTENAISCWKFDITILV